MMNMHSLLHPKGHLNKGTWSKLTHFLMTVRTINDDDVGGCGRVWEKERVTMISLSLFTHG